MDAQCRRSKPVGYVEPLSAMQPIVIDTSTDSPLIIVDSTLSVLWFCSRGLSEYLSGNVFEIVEKRLVVRFDEARRKIAAAVEGCIVHRAPRWSRIKQVNSDLIVRVCPCRRTVNGSEDVVASISIGALAARSVIDLSEAYFVERWGLSDREARVALLLVSDESLREIAIKLSLSVETVRWYQKTFCDRFSVSGRVGFLHRVYQDLLSF